ncbi:MAG: hypothetical protein ACXWRE_10180 [Pseudobdellovibrionaceae bacterium]
MSLKSLFSSFLALFFCTFFTACSQYSDGGLVGDYQSTFKCPANGCANQAPNANALKLSTVDNVVSLYPTANDTKVEISGDCYASTYPSNKINVTVVTQNGNVPVNAGVYSATGSSTAPACRKGKYDVVIDIRNLALNAIYTVKLDLVAYDSSNNAISSSGAGSLFLNLIR